MDLTTLERVKVGLGDAGNQNDALLAQLITSISVDLERRMKRYVQSAQRVEVVPVVSGYRCFSLRGTPLDPDSVAVVACPTRDFAGPEAFPYKANVDYVVDPENGLVNILRLFDTRIIGATLAPLAPGFFQVTYTGGLAADTAGLIAAYPDLADACDLQVVHRFKRKDSAGAVKQTMGGTESTSTGEYKLLDRVEQVCAFYRRTVFT